MTSKLNREYRLSEIAEKLGLVYEGRKDPLINGIAPIETAGSDELTFFGNPKLAPFLDESKAGAIIVPNFVESAPVPFIRTKNPYLAFARCLPLFFDETPFPAGVHATAVIHPEAKIGENAQIGPFCFVDDGVEIGPGAQLHSFVSIYRGARIGKNFRAHSHCVVRESCELGDDVTLQNGVVIGSDGFGFVRDEQGDHVKLRQVGTVVIEDNVEIQALSCIDRATIGSTRIKKGAKIDNLVQVGHSCEVGERSLLCGQVGLAGSTTLGRDVTLAGQVGVAGHLKIGDKVTASAQSGIDRDVEAGQTISGYHARDSRHWLKCVSQFFRLPDLAKEVRELKKRVEELESDSS